MKGRGMKNIYEGRHWLLDSITETDTLGPWCGRGGGDTKNECAGQDRAPMEECKRRSSKKEEPDG